MTERCETSAFDIGVRREYPLCTEDGWQYCPAIYGTTVAWSSETGSFTTSDISLGTLPEVVCRPCDMDYNGVVSIVGDVLAFVKVVYFGDLEWYQQQYPGEDPTCPGDCDGDGMLTIVGDVPCFADCVYLGNCPD